MKRQRVKVVNKMRTKNRQIKELYEKSRATYLHIGTQMRGLVTFSVFMQHVAFSTLLLKHWDKTNWNSLGPNGQWAYMGSIILYWCLSLLAMMNRLAHEVYLYWIMSILVVNIEPPKEVVLDFTLLLLTVSFTSTTVIQVLRKSTNSYRVVNWLQIP